MNPSRPRRRQMKSGRQQTPNPPSPPPPPPSLPPATTRSPQHNRIMRLQRKLIIRGGTRHASPGPAKKTRLGPPPPPATWTTNSRPLNATSKPPLPLNPPPPPPPGTARNNEAAPVQGASTPLNGARRLRRLASGKGRGQNRPTKIPNVSPAPLPRRVPAGSGPISLEEETRIETRHPSRPHSLPYFPRTRLGTGSTATWLACTSRRVLQFHPLSYPWIASLGRQRRWRRRSAAALASHEGNDHGYTINTIYRRTHGPSTGIW